MNEIGKLVGLLVGLSKFRDWIMAALTAGNGFTRWRAAKPWERVRYTLDDDSPIRFAIAGERAELVYYNRLDDGSVEFDLEKQPKRAKKHPRPTP